MACRPGDAHRATGRAPSSRMAMPQGAKSKELKQHPTLRRPALNAEVCLHMSLKHSTMKLLQGCVLLTIPQPGIRRLTICEGSQGEEAAPARETYSHHPVSADDSPSSDSSSA